MLLVTRPIITSTQRKELHKNFPMHSTLTNITAMKTLLHITIQPEKNYGNNPMDNLMPLLLAPEQVVLFLALVAISKKKIKILKS
jgi:hypothetical protein